MTVGPCYYILGSTARGVDPHVNHGFWVTAMLRSRFIVRIKWAVWWQRLGVLGPGYTSFCTFASLCCEPKTTQKTAQVKISLFLLNGSRGNAIFYPLTTYFLTSKYLITHLKLSRSTALTYLWNNFIPKLLKILPTWHCMPKTAFGLFYFQETPPVLQGTGSIISKVCFQYDIKT